MANNLFSIQIISDRQISNFSKTCNNFSDAIRVAEEDITSSSIRTPFETKQIIITDNGNRIKTS